MMRSDTTDLGAEPKKEASGRFLLRIDPALHRMLRSCANESGLSLNEFCRLKLGAPGGGFPCYPAGADLLEKATVQFDTHLIGLAIFGSWALSEAHSESDVDVLVAVSEEVRLKRRLYEMWDREPVSWDGLPVEPHFVHLPRTDQNLSGVWAEVALGGIVLFEREFRLSRRLIRVRLDIMAGRLRRRFVHGQPYWVEVA